MKVNEEVSMKNEEARRRRISSPSGRKKVAHRFNGGSLAQNQSSPAGTAEKMRSTTQAMN
jgi:hypothetical protein